MDVGGITTTDGLRQMLQKKKIVDFFVTYFEIIIGVPMRHDELKMVSVVLNLKELKED